MTALPFSGTESVHMHSSNPCRVLPTDSAKSLLCSIPQSALSVGRLLGMKEQEYAPVTALGHYRGKLTVALAAA